MENTAFEIILCRLKCDFPTSKGRSADYDSAFDAVEQVDLNLKRMSESDSKQHRDKLNALKTKMQAERTQGQKKSGGTASGNISGQWAFV